MKAILEGARAAICIALVILILPFALLLEWLSPPELKDDEE